MKDNRIALCILLACLIQAPSLAQVTRTDTQTQLPNLAVAEALEGAFEKAMARQEALVAIETDRLGYVLGIIDAGRGLALSRGYSPGWEREWEQRLMTLADEDLMTVGLSEDFKDLGTSSLVTLAERDLGDTTSDLVYTPVPPCRVLDTRFASITGLIGPIAGNTTINFRINDSASEIPAQGGNAAGCPEVPLGPEPAAVALTITAVPSAAGNLRAFAFAGTLPSASVLNYSPGVNIANTSVVPSCVLCGHDVAIRVDVGATHLIVDIVGYLRAPGRAPLDNNVLVTEMNIAAGLDFSVFSPSCPTGFRLTGGGFLSPLFSDNFFVGSRPAMQGELSDALGINVANSWLCQGSNTTGVTKQISCYAVCVRTPGI